MAVCRAEVGICCYREGKVTEYDESLQRAGLSEKVVTAEGSLGGEGVPRLLP